MLQLNYESFVRVNRVNEIPDCSPGACFAGFGIDFPSVWMGYTKNAFKTNTLGILTIIRIGGFVQCHMEEKNVTSMGNRSEVRVS